MEPTTFGADLPKGEAKRLFERFCDFKATLPEAAQAVIPDAVCFTVAELQDYLTRVNAMFEDRGIDESLRAIAFMPGKHNGLVDKTHLRYKCTTVLVASKVEANEDGQVTFIENCVFSDAASESSVQEDDDDGVGDVSYDVGDLKP